MWYQRAMADQVTSLKWRTRTFKIHTNHTDVVTILDIGCGLKPFKQLFVKANKKGFLRYIGLDKSALHISEKIKVSADNICAILDEYTPDTVFFGNSLHCLSDSTFVLTEILNRPEVKDIIIVDYRSESIHGLTLSYHLSQHTDNWSNPSMEAIMRLAENSKRKVRILHPSSQHQMIKIGPMGIVYETPCSY
jgi:hypothetical protein